MSDEKKSVSMTRRQWITVCGIAVGSAVVASTATSLWAHNSAEADLTSKANSLSSDISSVNSSLGSVNSTLTSGLNSANSSLNSTATTLSNSISKTATNVTNSLDSTFAPVPVVVPLSLGVIEFNNELCTQCLSCTMLCAYYHEGAAQPSLSRMQVPVDWLIGQRSSISPCFQCVEPQCLRYCPYGAITVDTASGTNARVIDSTKCNGCGACIEACPFTPKRVQMNFTKDVAFKCDLCKTAKLTLGGGTSATTNLPNGTLGAPACVDICPTGALTYYTNSQGVTSGYPIITQTQVTGSNGSVQTGGP